jgi:tetratricopeptide (TPR) repeat protein
VLAVSAAAIGYFFYTSQPDYLMAKGSESLAQGNLAQAKQIADRLQRKGHNSAAHILRGRVLLYHAREQLEKAPPPFPYEGMQRAAQMVLGGAALNGCPWALRGPGWLAAVQVQQPFPRHIPGVEDLLDAFEEFSQVLDDDPWAAEATVWGAECLVRLGDYRSAEHALATVVYRQPDNLDAHRYLAAIYVDVNATALALPQLREWIRLDANDPQPYRWLSDITHIQHTESGIQEGIEAYRKLLQLKLDDSERAEVGMKLAEVQISRLAEYQQALDTLAEVPKSFQDRTSFMLLRAECLQGLGQGDEARNLVDAMLKEHPTNPDGLLFRAKIYLQEDQPQSAIALLERLLALHPNDASARRNLMLAYRWIRDERRAAEQEQLFEALQAKRRPARELWPVVAREPGNGSARLEMANLNLSDNPSEALTWIRFALASSPEDPRIRKTWTQLFGYQPPPILRDFQRRKQAKIN